MNWTYTGMACYAACQILDIYGQKEEKHNEN